MQKLQRTKHRIKKNLKIVMGRVESIFCLCKTEMNLFIERPNILTHMF